MSTVRDLDFSQFQHHRKVVNLPSVESENLIADVSDAVYVAQLMMKSRALRGLRAH